MAVSSRAAAGPIVGAGILATVGAGGCFIANGFGNADLAASIGSMRIPRRCGSVSSSGGPVTGATVAAALS